LLSVSPHIKQGNSLEELAAAMGLPAATLRDSVEHYNSFIDEGLEQDPDFGRPLSGRQKIEQPPFYALNYFPLARKTFGGVKTDLFCRVLNKYFKPLYGLYAAGEVAGMAGGHINGKAGLEGTMLGPSLFSGRVAGAGPRSGVWLGFLGVILADFRYLVPRRFTRLKVKIVLEPDKPSRLNYLEVNHLERR
jgi:succinate dehydrogenase/fumarate reductase flavoprotein subunit